MALHRQIKPMLSGLAKQIGKIHEEIDQILELVERRHWWHERSVDRDKKMYPAGPLQGTQTELAGWIFETQTTRRLHNANINGTLWITRTKDNEYLTYFPSESWYQEALERKLSSI